MANIYVSVSDDNGQLVLDGSFELLQRLLSALRDESPKEGIEDARELCLPAQEVARRAAPKEKSGAAAR